MQEKRRQYIPLALALLSLLALPGSALAQTSGPGSWNILNLRYTHNDKISFFGEAQLRSLQFYNQFHYYEYKGGMNYKANKSITLTLGMGSYQTYREGGNFVKPKNNDEFRIWPQVNLHHSINRFTIEHRYRMELRWTSNGYRNRFRYRAAVSYPFGKASAGFRPFQVSASNELFFSDREPYFERNRAQLSLNYKPAKNTTLQLGYLHQFDYRINDETGRDFLVVGFFFELMRKKNEKASAPVELNDN